jgi:hypothetical protein
MTEPGAFIGFPEGMVRDKPVRLPILANESTWFCLDKSAGLAGQAHPWYSDRLDVSSAIRKQAEKGKGELKRLGILGAHYICGPEPEFEGPMILSKDKGTAHILRNDLG